MTAFQPELPELPAVRVCRDRFAVQGKNRRVERIGNADSQRLDKGFFQRPEPEKGFVRHGAFQHKPGFIRRKRAVQHAGPQRTDGFAVHPQDASEMPHAASPRQWLRLKQISGCAGK